jgi:hypothetical protein
MTVGWSGNNITVTWSYTTTATTGVIPQASFSTTAASVRVAPMPSKVRAGKYRVRCRGCGRWAKILSETITFGWPRWKVECVRCFGENEGFAA